MPNWCENYIELTHTDKSLIKRAKEALEGKSAVATVGFLQEFLPIPQELIDTVAGWLGAGTKEQLELEAKSKANKEKYGYENWYDYAVAEWGTKWEVHDARGVKIYRKPGDNYMLAAYFDTAWGPPIQAYRKLMDQYGFCIKAYYFEPGMCFMGVFDNGEDACIDNVSPDILRIESLFNASSYFTADDEEELEELDGI